MPYVEPAVLERSEDAIRIEDSIGGEGEGDGLEGSVVDVVEVSLEQGGDRTDDEEFCELGGKADGRGGREGGIGVGEQLCELALLVDVNLNRDR